MKLKKILLKIYKFGLNPYVNIVFGLVIMMLPSCLLFNLVDSFDAASVVAGVSMAIGCDIYGYGLSKFLRLRRLKKRSDHAA